MKKRIFKGYMSQLSKNKEKIDYSSELSAASPSAEPIILW